MSQSWITWGLNKSCGLQTPPGSLPHPKLTTTPEIQGPRPAHGQGTGPAGWGTVPGYPGLDPCPAGLFSGTVVDAQSTPPAPNDKEDPQGALRQPLLLPPPGLLGGASICVSPAWCPSRGFQGSNVIVTAEHSETLLTQGPCHVHTRSRGWAGTPQQWGLALTSFAPSLPLLWPPSMTEQSKEWNAPCIPLPVPPISPPVYSPPSPTWQQG